MQALALPAHADAPTPIPMQQLMELARGGAAALPADARIEIEPGQLDPRLKLTPCRRIEPYLPTVVIAGGALKAVGGAQADAMIPEIIAGNAIIAFAYAEPQGRYDFANLRTTAKKDGAGYMLNGHKGVV